MRYRCQATSLTCTSAFSTFAKLYGIDAHMRGFRTERCAFRTTHW